MNFLRSCSILVLLFTILAISAVAASGLLSLVGATTGNLVTISQFKLLASPVSVELETLDKRTKFGLRCSKDYIGGTQISAWSCRIREGEEKILMSEFRFVERDTEPVCGSGREYVMSWNIWPYAAIYSDPASRTPFRDQKGDNPFGYLDDIEITPNELEIHQETLGSVTPLCFFGERAANIVFTLETPSIEAIVSDTLVEASAFRDSEIPHFTRQRLAAALTRVIEDHTGLFTVRRISGDEAPENNGIRLLLTGWFEYMILTLGVFALILSIVAISPGTLAAGLAHPIGKLGVRIAGLLTYLGLLGTLYGVFGAVNSLSEIDFLNEFKRVFDQTESFGAMSLAIGTSVVGLGTAIIVGFVQSVLAGAVRVDPFE